MMEWVRLENMDEEQFARHLIESRIFLATSTQEGIPTSMLEAMASGCLVVGYAGVGGNDYLTGSGVEQNCILIENGDLPGLGRCLEYVLTEMERDCHRFDHVIHNGIETAKRFENFDDEGKSLTVFFNMLGCSPVVQNNASLLDAAQSMSCVFASTNTTQG